MNKEEFKEMFGELLRDGEIIIDASHKSDSKSIIVLIYIDGDLVYVNSN